MDTNKTDKPDGKQQTLAAAPAGQEDIKLRVAITQGDANGVGFEMIFKMFAEPEMFELCTPIVYGSPKIASYHAKALGVHCPYGIINKAEDARDNRVNLLVCFDEEIKVEFGKRTSVSPAPATSALTAAVHDVAAGLVDVLVSGPVDRRETETADGEKVNLGDYVYYLADKERSTLRLFQNDIMRIATVSDGSLTHVAADFGKERIETMLRQLHATLRRDYRLDTPRIAVLGLSLNDECEENKLLREIIARLAEEDIQAFGPYRSDNFFVHGEFEAFDAILAMYPEQALLPMRMLSDSITIVVHAGLPFVCTAPLCGAQTSIAGRGKADEAWLRQAVYAASDMFAARRSYDLAHANPLKKLYKERSDSGEKPYITLPKKTDKEDGQQ
ncbi:MAG: 4-hydroxythreonine-4-phosphate dehydrogenase PdxA [Prevotella sp.]|nr:4-hydroxythreonine-4-phosphate dehydrogenase PdxA [Prevotella sp.]